MDVDVVKNKRVRILLRLLSRKNAKENIHMGGMSEREGGETVCRIPKLNKNEKENEKGKCI